jgi:tetratricopeptide (TPR) repeat protein
MKILFSFLLSFLFLNSARGQSYDSLLTVLKSEILKKNSYEGIKENDLKQLKKTLAAVPRTSVSTHYAVLNNIIEAYRDYSFDSAHVYTYKLIQVSNLLKDRQKQYESKIRLGALQLSWGMFKEAFDCISEINVNALPDSTKLRFYEFKARALNEISTYNSNRFYSPINRQESIKALDSAVLLSKPGTYDKYKSLGQLYSITDQRSKAVVVLRQLLNKKDLTIHQRAMVINDLSYLVPNPEKEKLLMIAAIYDIRSATKQTMAISRLGTKMLEKGELANAEILLNEAIAETIFFGNKIQERNISISLSQLAAEKLIRSENKKIDLLIILIIVVSLGLIGIGIISFIVYARLKAVKIRETAVQEKYRFLDQINKRLLEDGRIKEEYLGHFFHLISGYISRLEKVKRNTEHKLKIKNYEGLMLQAKEINIKKEREDLFYTFDTIFLKLFPNFIQSFNALLKTDDQIVPKSGEILNTNLRIFALMRLGIKDAQTIANILESTLSTVYTYKNRIKSKSLYHGEEFDSKIMEIKFVDVQEPSTETFVH